MKRKITAAISVIVSVICVLTMTMPSVARGTPAVDGRKTVEVLRIDPEKVTIGIDGEIDDIWKGANAVQLETLHSDVSNGSAVIGENCSSATVKVLWNGKNVLYMLYEVTDSGLYAASSNSWECDAIVFATDWDNWKDGQSSGGRHERVLYNAGSGQGAGYDYATKITDTGFIVEIQLITEEYVAGDYIGLDFEVDDGREDGSRFAAIGWSSDTNDTWATKAKLGQGLLSATEATVPADAPALPAITASISDSASDGKIDHLYLNAAVSASETREVGIIFSDSEASCAFGANPLFIRVAEEGHGKSAGGFIQSGCYGSNVITAVNLGGADGDSVLAVYWKDMPTSYGTLYARTFAINDDGTYVYGAIASISLTEGADVLPLANS